MSVAPPDNLDNSDGGLYYITSINKQVDGTVSLLFGSQGYIFIWGICGEG